MPGSVKGSSDVFHFSLRYISFNPKSCDVYC